MRKTSAYLSLSACLLFASPMWAQTGGTVVAAPSTTAPAVAPADPLKAEELDQLLGPIALYPDALVAIILPASTYPSDVVLAARYLDDGGDVDKLDEQPWDDSVRALARYPEVVQWMDENLAWTRQLGEAYLAQQGDVMASMQRLRGKAKANGALADTPQQKVIVEDSNTIAIVPAQREVIYVPRYDPEVVFVERRYYTSSPLYFGLGFSVGSWLVYSCDWHSRVIYVGHRHHWHPHYWHHGRPGHWHDGPRHAWRPRYERPHHRPRPHHPGWSHHISRPRPIGERRPDRDRWQNRPDRRPPGGSNLHADNGPQRGNPRPGRPEFGNRPQVPGGNRGNSEVANRPTSQRRPDVTTTAAPVTRPRPDVKTNTPSRVAPEVRVPQSNPARNNPAFGGRNQVTPPATSVRPSAPGRETASQLRRAPESPPRPAPNLERRAGAGRSPEVRRAAPVQRADRAHVRASSPSTGNRAMPNRAHSPNATR